MKDEHYYNIFMNIRQMILDAYTDIQIIERISFFAIKNKEDNKKYKNNIVFILGHIMELAKKDLCLNIWKFAIDDGDDTNSFGQLRKHLALLPTPIHIEIHKIDKNCRNKIKEFRKKILAHNLQRGQLESIELKDFKEVVANAIEDINKCYMQEIDERVVGISNADLGAVKLSSHSAIFEIMKNLE